MALDRQKILNELGSVVSQLQRADCGCMGKLFSPSCARVNSYHTPQNQCAHNTQGCCRGNCNTFSSPCAGEPCSGVRNCMGFCNPPKLYADTYNYLNQNLMQPVVREVYDDLKSISPANTVMNNPMVAQMGLQANNPNQGNTMTQHSTPGGAMGNPNGMSPHMPGHTHHMHNNYRYAEMNANNQNYRQGMGEMGQGMGHMGQGMGHMGQGMGHVCQGMGHMGQGMNRMGQMDQGGRVAQGMGHMGHGMNHMGHGMSHMGHEMGHMGHGVGHVGHGMGHVGHGMGHVGHGMGHMGHGEGHMGHGMGHMGHEMGQMGQEKMGQGIQPGGMLTGMGPQIVNMMRSSANPNGMPNQGGPPTNEADAMKHSPEMDQMVSHIPAEVDQGQYDSGYMQNNTGHMEMNRMRQGDPGMQTTQYMSQPNMFPGATANGNAMPGNMNKSNPTTQGMGNMNAPPNPNQMNNANRYGQHSSGIAKFNEMFPGVMKNDLGFDPMAIAIQMNPANIQKSAMDTMQKMMMNNAGGIGRIIDSGHLSSKMQPVINATHTASASLAQPKEPLNQDPSQQNMVPLQQRQPGEMTAGAEMKNNQVYSAPTGAPTINQQPTQQINAQEQLQQHQWQQQQPPDQPSHQPPQQQMMNPNTEAVVSGALPTVFEGDPNSGQQQPLPRQTPKDMYREPIFPADTTRNLLHSHHFTKPQRFIDYNTLGQPVEMLPSKQYQIPIPSLPQTLSPQPAPVRYSNVKNTVSKTSLMGNKPVGKTPSRSQLQQVYNHYKGSHSYTHQNIKPSARNGSFSEGRINVPPANQAHHNYHHAHQTPIEIVGGDTAANNYIMDQHENVKANKKRPSDLETSSARNFKLRNGLQDQVFTSAPTSAKWSFHGTSPVPFSVGYRIRNR